MWPDRVLNPGPLTYESGAPPIALRGPAPLNLRIKMIFCLSEGMENCKMSGENQGKVRDSG